MGVFRGRPGPPMGVPPPGGTADGAGCGSAAAAQSECFGSHTLAQGPVEVGKAEVYLVQC